MKKIFKTLAIIAFSATVLSCSSDDSQSQKTIVGIASGNSDFSILVSALNRAGLTSTLDGSGQFTVFTNKCSFTSFLSANGFASIDAVP